MRTLRVLLVLRTVHIVDLVGQRPLFFNICLFRWHFLAEMLGLRPLLLLCPLSLPSGLRAHVRVFRFAQAPLVFGTT